MSGWRSLALTLWPVTLVTAAVLQLLTGTSIADPDPLVCGLLWGATPVWWIVGTLDPA